jgi:phosphatidylethanolamine/phosphatidyl-N-methylethanolamine N-methyltransferase
VPHPDLLLAEMKRVVRPGGWLIFVNHFSAERGPRLWAEKALAPLARRIGWHPHFPIQTLLPPDDLARAARSDLPPLGLFSLVSLRLG